MVKRIIRWLFCHRYQCMLCPERYYSLRELREHQWDEHDIMI